MSANNRKHYVVEKVPDKMIGPGSDKTLWYCHMAGFPNIPVLGSIGGKRNAESVCRTRNLDGKVHYA